MRQYFHPASDSSPKRPHRKTKLKSLSLQELTRQLESVEYQLRNPLFLHQAQLKALKKRKADLSNALWQRKLEASHKARMKALRNPLGLDEELRDFLLDEVNPARKALCKVQNHGFRRPKPPSPTGKTIGAFRVVRPKGRIDRLVSERKKK